MDNKKPLNVYFTSRGFLCREEINRTDCIMR